MLKGHVKAVLSLAFSPDGKTLVSGDSGGTLFVWDPSHPENAQPASSRTGARSGDLAFTPTARP